MSIDTKKESRSSLIRLLNPGGMPKSDIFQINNSPHPLKPISGLDYFVSLGNLYSFSDLLRLFFGYCVIRLLSAILAFWIIVPEFKDRVVVRQYGKFSCVIDTLPLDYVFLLCSFHNNQVGTISCSDSDIPASGTLRERYRNFAFRE